jgi:DNA processing protein
MCVDLQKPTIAFVANGLDTVYHAENRQLAEKIVEFGGLIASEYRFGTKPSAFQFPERNRLICGLSKGVFIPEAKLGSGSLITAGLAIEQGKSLYYYTVKYKTVRREQVQICFLWICREHWFCRLKMC